MRWSSAYLHHLDQGFASNCSCVCMILIRELQQIDQFSPILQFLDQELQFPINLMQSIVFKEVFLSLL